MVFGIVSIIIGVVIFIFTLLKDISTVQQQTVQYLGFIWASLFVIGGLIMITIKKCISEYNAKSKEYIETPIISEQKKEPETNSKNIDTAIKREKIKSIEDFFNDESLMKEAKELRRLYGKNVYISHLKDKAKELGLGDIDISEDDIE
jgi:hypothetical protein